MPHDWTAPVTLEDANVRLVPLAREHADPLAHAASTPETFRYFSRAPREISPAGMAEFIDFLLGPAQTQPFCVIHRADQRPVGITTYLDIRPAHRALEIGWTWYAPDRRGTRTNPACKRLLMQHAFETLGAIRVCLKTDERNARSRAAILKLGAKFEGILRENVIMSDGFRRSTAMYSVLASEWAQVKRGLETRL